MECLVSGLVRGVDEHISVPVQEGDSALRLQKGVFRPRCLEVVANDVLGAANGSLGVAAADVLVGTDIVLFLIEHLRRVRSRRLLGIVDGGQDLVLYFNKLLGLFQGLPVLRRHQGNGVAQIVGQATHRNQCVLIVFQMADLILAGNVLRRQDGNDAGQGLGCGGIDGQHPGAGILAPQGGAVQHPVRIVVIGVFAGAQDLFIRVKALDTGAQFPVVRAFGRYDAVPENLSRQLDSGHDFHIAGAPAVVVPQGVANLRLCGGRVFIQQGLAAHDHAGNAEAALNRAGLGIGVAVDLLLPLCQALHSDDAASLQCVRIRHTGLTGLAVDDNRAGAAGALAAPVLHAGEMQFIPQEAQQLLIFFDGHGLAVHGKPCHE